MFKPLTSESAFKKQNLPYDSTETEKDYGEVGTSTMETYYDTEWLQNRITENKETSRVYLGGKAGNHGRCHDIPKSTPLFTLNLNKENPLNTDGKVIGSLAGMYWNISDPISKEVLEACIRPIGPATVDYYGNKFFDGSLQEETSVIRKGIFIVRNGPEKISFGQRLAWRVPEYDDTLGVVNQLKCYGRDLENGRLPLVLMPVDARSTDFMKPYTDPEVPNHVANSANITANKVVMDGIEKGGMYSGYLKAVQLSGALLIGVGAGSLLQAAVTKHIAKIQPFIDNMNYPKCYPGDHLEFGFAVSDARPFAEFSACITVGK